MTALIVAGIIVGVALLTTGAFVALLSGGAPLKVARRQLAIAYGAAAVSYLPGMLFGTYESKSGSFRGSRAGRRG